LPKDKKNQEIIKLINDELAESDSQKRIAIMIENTITTKVIFTQTPEFNLYSIHKNAKS
jgi:hypothetical protein